VAQRRTTTTIGTLDAHPNVDEVRGILSRLPCITDDELSQLADAWHNTTLLSEARRRALEPDSPLIVEVLGCFDTLQALFADEIRGDDDTLTVDPDTTSLALKAVRDAIAAAYSRPALAAGEHAALLKAWRSVFPTDHVVDPDFGHRRADVMALLVAMPRLANRCHDNDAAAEFDVVAAAAIIVDDDLRDAARDEAWQAAIIAAKRRVWQLIRRSGAESLGQYCSTCRERERDEETIRVLELCIDAACGLLVAQDVDDDIVEVLVTPVRSLIPTMGPPATG
jgi:hypothetical protein